MPKKRRVDLTDDQIVEVYAELHSVPKVAERTGLGETTIDRVLRRRGVARIGLAEYRAGMKPGRPEYTYYRYSGSADEIIDWYLDGASMREIAARIGRSTHVVSTIIQKAGVSRPWGGKGPDHNGWQGGRLPATGGYWRVWVSADDPMASMRNHQGYVLEHRLVLARKLGRALRRAESVHHLDGDRANNHPDNLQLRHGKHGSGVVLVCMSCGSRDIGFDALGAPRSTDQLGRIAMLEAEIVRLRDSHQIDPSAGNGASTSSLRVGADHEHRTMRHMPSLEKGMVAV